MRCVAIDASGYVVDVLPQPVDTLTCTLAVGSPDEFGSGFPHLSADGGAQIAVAIGGMWAVAWCFVQIARVIKEGN